MVMLQLISGCSEDLLLLMTWNFPCNHAQTYRDLGCRPDSNQPGKFVECPSHVCSWPVRSEHCDFHILRLLHNSFWNFEEKKKMVSLRKVFLLLVDVMVCVFRSREQHWGGYFLYWLSCHFGLPHPVLKHLGWGSRLFPDSSSCQFRLWDVPSDGSRNWVPAAQLGNLDWISSSWLWPGILPVLGRPLESKPADERFSLSFFPALSPSQINK